MDVDYLRSEFNNVLNGESLDIKTGEDIIYAEQIATNGYGLLPGIFRNECKAHYDLLESANFLKLRQNMGTDQTGMNDLRRSIVQEKINAHKSEIEKFLNSQPQERTYIILLGTLGDFYTHGPNYEYIEVSDNRTFIGEYGSTKSHTLYDIYSELLCCGKLHNVPKIDSWNHYILGLICKYSPKDVLSFYGEFEKMGLGIKFNQYNSRNNGSYRHVIPLFEMLLEENLLSLSLPKNAGAEIQEFLDWNFIHDNPDLQRKRYYNAWRDLNYIEPYINETKNAGITSGLLPEFSDKLASVGDTSKLRNYCGHKASEIAHKLIGAR